MSVGSPFFLFILFIADFRSLTIEREGVSQNLPLVMLRIVMLRHPIGVQLSRTAPTRLQLAQQRHLPRLLSATTAHLHHQILGVSPGASRGDIKRQFYELAKELHPDVCADTSKSTIPFTEVLAAYEALMRERDADEQSAAKGGGRRTAPSKAARGARAARRKSAQPPQARAEMTVGEVLCERLYDDDCSSEMVDAVWRDVKDLHNFEAHPLTDFMIDALFSACVRTGGGLDSALVILRDGKRAGPMAGSAQVSAACALMKWCSEDVRMSFELIVGEVDDHERTPEALERLQSSYYIHFGVDPLTAWR